MFSIVPIRMEDRYDIMKWRNEQIYHLRQNKPLPKRSRIIISVPWLSRFLTKKSPNKFFFPIWKAKMYWVWWFGTYKPD